MADIDGLREEFPNVPVTEERRHLSPEALSQAHRRVERESNLAVGTVVRDDGNRVLLVSNAWSDGWIVPGGLVNGDESLTAAARREVREEAGVDVAIEEPIEFRRQRLHGTGDEEDEENEEDEEEVTMWFVGFHGRSLESCPETSADSGVDGEAIDDVAWFEDIPANCADVMLLELAGVID